MSMLESNSSLTESRPARGSKPSGVPKGGATMCCCNATFYDPRAIDFQETTGIYLPEMQLEGIAERAPWRAASPSRQAKLDEPPVDLLATEDSSKDSTSSSSDDAYRLRFEESESSLDVGLTCETEVHATTGASAGFICCSPQAAGIDGSELALDRKPATLQAGKQRVEGSLADKMASDYLVPPRTPLETRAHPASPPKGGSSITYAREIGPETFVADGFGVGGRTRSEIIVTQAEDDEPSRTTGGPCNALLACCQGGANYQEISPPETRLTYHAQGDQSPGQRMHEEYVRPPTKGVADGQRNRYCDQSMGAERITYASDYPLRQGKTAIGPAGPSTQTRDSVRHHESPKVKPDRGSSQDNAKGNGAIEDRIRPPGEIVSHTKGEPCPKAEPEHPGHQRGNDPAHDKGPAESRDSSSTGSVDQPQAASDARTTPKPSGGNWGLFKVCCDPSHGAPPPETVGWKTEADRERQVGQIDVDRARNWPSSGPEQSNVARFVHPQEIDEDRPDKPHALDYLTRPSEDVYNEGRGSHEAGRPKLPEYTGQTQPRLSYSKDFAKGGWSATATGPRKTVETSDLEHQGSRQVATTTNSQASKKGGIASFCCGREPEPETDEGENRYRLALPGDLGCVEPSDLSLLGPYIQYEPTANSGRTFAEARTQTTSSGDSKSQREAADAALSLVKAPNVKGGSSFKTTDKAQFINKISGAVFYNDVVAPASVAAEEKEPWESVYYELVHPQRESLWIKFVLGADGLLRGHLTAPDSEGYRNYNYNCSIIPISTDDGSPRLYTDNYIALPGPKTILLKDEEGFTLSVRRIVRGDEPWNINFVLIHVSAFSRDSISGGDLRADFEAMYHSEVYRGGSKPVSNVTVVCERTNMPATRAVLMARSKVFAQMLHKKSKADVLVTGAPPAVVQNLLDYMHTDRCELLGKFDDLPMLVKLFEISVRFAVAALMNELAIQLATNLSSATVDQIEHAANKTRHAFLMEAVNRFRKVHS